VSDKVIVLEVEVPAIYTADLDELRDHWQRDAGSESDFLLNCIGEPSAVRLRTEISGEKDSEITEVWGQVRAARLEEPSPGVTDDELADRGWKLLRDEDSCEWCDLERHTPEGTP
jgi:hypothetical protein